MKTAGLWLVLSLAMVLPGQARAEVHLNCGGEGQKPCKVDPCELNPDREQCKKKSVAPPKPKKNTIDPCDMGCPKEGCPCPEQSPKPKPPPKP